MHQLHISIKDDPFFFWQGGKDDQVPPTTFKNFVAHLKRKKNEVIFIPEGLHSPSETELKMLMIAYLFSR
jgi:fermentation-respiration switch protein FrsA (DUF1100 family)